MENMRNGVYEEHKEDMLNQQEQINKKTNVFFIIWNIISVLGYVIFIFIQMSFSIENKTFYIITIIAIIIYITIFILMMVFIKDNTKLRLNLKTYKITAKILKKSLQLYNLVLSIMLLIKSINTSNKVISIIGSVFMGLIIFIGLLIDFLSIVYRKKIEDTKQRYSKMIKDNIKELKE